MPNWPNECTQMLRLYERISSLSASYVLNLYSVQIGCRSNANSQNSEFFASYNQNRRSMSDLYTQISLLQLEFFKHFSSQIDCLSSVKTLLLSAGVSRESSPYSAQLSSYSFLVIRI